MSYQVKVLKDYFWNNKPVKDLTAEEAQAAVISLIERIENMPSQGHLMDRLIPRNPFYGGLEYGGGLGAIGKLASSENYSDIQKAKANLQVLQGYAATKEASKD